MKVLYFNNKQSIKKEKSIGHIALSNMFILSECQKGKQIADLIRLPFYYKFYKNKTWSNKYINAAITSTDNSKKYYVQLNKRQRKKLYLMYKGHWYFNNWYTRNMVKHYEKIHTVLLILFFGGNVFKLIKASVAMLALIKGCN